MRKLFLLLLLLPASAFAQKVNLPTQVRGILPCADMPALTGDITSSSGTCTTVASPTFALKSGVQQQSYTYSADSGSANAYAVTLSPAPSLVAGSQVCFLAVNGNTTASTLAVNGGSAKAIKKGATNDLGSGDIVSGQIVCVVYDGANFQLVSPLPTGTGTVTTTGSPAANQVALFSSSTVIKGAASDSTTTHALFATAGAPAFRAIASGDLPPGLNAFSALTSSTNTTAAMVVGTGSTLGVSGSGTIDVTSLLGGTWAIPGTIGSTTRNTGAFSSLACGVASTTSCVFTGSGSTSGTATLTWPAVAGTTSNAIVSSNAWQAPNLISTISTGTAPLTVSSTTVVPNLNVSQLLGGTWAIPGTIGSTTPNTGAFTDLTATDVTTTGTGTGSYSVAGSTTGACSWTTQSTAATEAFDCPLSSLEQAAPSGISGSDILYPDLGAHRWKMINNGGSALTVASLESPVFTTNITTPILLTATKCAAAGTAANPSVVSCSAAPSGSFACDTAASGGTCTINTSAVTSASAIFVQPDSSLGSLLSVTCNTTADTGLTAPRVSARSANTSFTITLGTFSTNRLCFDYWVVN